MATDKEEKGMENRSRVWNGAFESREQTLLASTRNYKKQERVLPYHCQREVDSANPLALNSYSAQK